jgi:ParB family chromosome partitioning protein
MSAEKPRRLGRGLEALIASSPAGTAGPGSDLQRIAVSRIRPNPFQPRREFNPADLAELETSLASSGLLQPITVRRRGDAFELIAGERRLRAAANIGWTEIAAIVRDLDDRTMLVLALIENLQRSNLNAVEEAQGYRRLIEDFKLTQQQVAEAVGKDRTTVTNLLRVLSLPERVRQLVEQGSLSTGHARALLALSSPDAIMAAAKEAVDQGLSVRELEQRVREIGGKPKVSETRLRQPAAANSDPAIRRIEDELRRHFQTDIRVLVTGDSKGRVEISFYSTDDLDRLIDLILAGKRSDF